MGNQSNIPRLTTTEVVRRFHVDLHTLQRWVEEGRVRETRTLLGQRRFDESEVQVALDHDELTAGRWRESLHLRDEFMRDASTFITWLLDLDRPDRKAERSRTTLDLIIRRARDVAKTMDLCSHEPKTRTGRCHMRDCSNRVTRDVL